MVVDLLGAAYIFIDPRAEAVEGAARVITSPASAETLKEAGIDHAAGVVAATDSDYDNLEVLMAVRAMKPDAFTIARQNTHDHQIAFDAANANLVLQSSLTTARRVLKHLISPQVQVFVEYLRAQGEDICGDAVERLKATIGDNPPHLWQVRISEDEAGAIIEHLRNRESLTLGEMRRNPHDLDGFIDGIPLSIARDGDQIMLPADNQPVHEGDEILFCGTEHGELMLAASMNNIYTLDYLVSGEDRPRELGHVQIERYGEPLDSPVEIPDQLLGEIVQQADPLDTEKLSQLARVDRPGIVREADAIVDDRSRRRKADRFRLRCARLGQEMLDGIVR